MKIKRFMKYLSASAALVLFSALIFATAMAGHVEPVAYADCEVYGQRWELVSERMIICERWGEGEWSWGEAEEVIMQQMFISYGWGGSCSGSYVFGPNPMKKSDYCSSEGGPGPKSESSTPPRVVTLPPRQLWALTANEDSWCWMYGGTPIIFEGGTAVCFPGSPWSIANDFCLRGTYDRLEGCQLENYEVIDLSDLIL